jgi:hypothetical protein
VAAAVMGGVLVGGERLFDSMAADPSFAVQAVAVVALTVLGTAAYLGLAKVVGVPEFAYVTGLIKRRTAR